MKRTDKYRDSYQYDNQNQNHRRQSEDASYQQDNMLKAILKNTRNDTIMVEIIEENKFLKKKTRNPTIRKKWLYIIIAILLIIVGYFCHTRLT